jgi:hypothetical protein
MIFILIAYRPELNYNYPSQAPRASNSSGHIVPVITFSTSLKGNAPPFINHRHPPSCSHPSSEKIKLGIL